MATRRLRAELRQSGKTGKFYFRFVAGNGLLLASSKGYQRQRKARATLLRIFAAIADGQCEIAEVKA